MSNLVEHARREMELVETDQWFIDGMVNVVQAFADMGHSGGSASFAIPILHQLLQFNNLTPLTDDPDEWNEVGAGQWQSCRNPSAFSNDGGKTYLLMDEARADPSVETVFHKSEKKKERKTIKETES